MKRVHPSNTHDTSTPELTNNNLEPANLPPAAAANGALPRVFEPAGTATKTDRPTGADALPGSVEPHTAPNLTAHVAVGSTARDPRLGLLEGEAFYAHLAKAGKGKDDVKKVLLDIYNSDAGAQRGEIQADHWVRTAALQGHAGAQILLGCLHCLGWGVQQNYAEGFKWTQQAAEQGHPFAQAQLGRLYLNGRGVQKNDTEAFKWFQQAAEQGHPFAQEQLGTLYLNGRGVQQNYAEAFKWFQQAAEQGHPFAQAQLGILYAIGRGVQQNDAEGFRWIQQAAVQGVGVAMRNLARMYTIGRGIEKNDKQAAYWTLQSGLSADGATLSCEIVFRSEWSTFLPSLFRESPAWHSVTTLNLSKNAINDEGATHIAQLIVENPTLERLDLSNSQIGARGATALATALQSNLTLKALILDEVDSTKSARADIARALRSNANIVALANELEKNPVQISDELPLEVITLIEQAEIVVDQKTGPTERTQEQTQALIDEMRLAFARQSISQE